MYIHFKSAVLYSHRQPAIWLDQIALSRHSMVRSVPPSGKWYPALQEKLAILPGVKLSYWTYALAGAVGAGHSIAMQWKKQECQG